MTDAQETDAEVKPKMCADVDISGLCAPGCQLGRARYFRFKSRLDRLLAAFLFVPGMLAVLAVVVLVRLTSPGPGIYRQKRVGRNGKVFTMLKIRTMRHDAEAGTGVVWTAANDPRITRLGRCLRKLHLDELPQLLNVLRGEMSLVGPRPERPEFVAALVDQIPNYTDRLAVLPGVTGLAQINLPPDTDLASVRRKQALDLQYIQTASLWLDLRMIFCTSLRAVGVSGQRATQLLRLQRTASFSGDYAPLARPEAACPACSETLSDIDLHALQDTQTIPLPPPVEVDPPKETQRQGTRVLLSDPACSGNGNGNGSVKKRVGEPSGHGTFLPGKPR